MLDGSVGSPGTAAVATVVAIPGTLCDPAVFEPLRDRLRGQLDVVAVEWMSGDGPWTIADVATRIASGLAERGSDPVLLTGHSTGGAIAMWLALERPELVSGLVLIGTGSHMHGHGDVDAIIDRVDRDWGRGLWEAVLHRSFATPVTDRVHDRLVAYAAGVPRQAALDVLRSQRDLDLTPHLHRLLVPAVVVHGTLDPTRSIDLARELTASLPAAELRVVDAGHSPMWETPDLVADAVLAVAARARRSPPDPAVECGD